MQPLPLTRQCADPQSFFETHYASSIPIPVDMNVHQYFSRLSQSYAFYVQKTTQGVQSNAKYSTARMMDALKFPTTTHEDERKRMAETAKRLNQEANKPTVHQGAAVADMISSIYAYVARCAAQRLQNNGQLALTCVPNNAEALRMVCDDIRDPNITISMLEKLEDVDTKIMGEIRHFDMDKLNEHIELWESCNDFHADLTSFVARLRDDINKFKL